MTIIIIGPLYPGAAEWKGLPWPGQVWPFGNVLQARGFSRNESGKKRNGGVFTACVFLNPFVPTITIIVIDIHKLAQSFPKWCLCLWNGSVGPRKIAKDAVRALIQG